MRATGRLDTNIRFSETENMCKQLKNIDINYIFGSEFFLNPEKQDSRSRF